MSTQPLPPIAQDPSVIQAQEARASFTARAAAIRESYNLTDLQVAEQVVALWEEINSTVSGLYVDLQQRRAARIEVLDKIVPLGPSVPADASPADAAVLHSAFRSALTQARAAMPAGIGSYDPTGGITPLKTDTTSLDALLADAEKFGDDTLLRAVLTAAFEEGYLDLVRGWTDRMGVTAELDELAQLRAAHAGVGISGQWNFTTFQPLPAPSEVANLPRLQAAQEAAATARMQQARINGQALANSPGNYAGLATRPDSPRN